MTVHGGRSEADGHGDEQRVEAVRRLLDEAGVSGDVDVAGRDGDIAAVRAAPEARERLTELAPAIRAMGFRYVAIEPRGTTGTIEAS